VVWNMRWWSFRKWIDLTLRKSNLRTCGNFLAKHLFNIGREMSNIV
jgi:hypothetical protein